MEVMLYGWKDNCMPSRK